MKYRILRLENPVSYIVKKKNWWGWEELRHWGDGYKVRSLYNTIDEAKYRIRKEKSIKPEPKVVHEE